MKRHRQLHLTEIDAQAVSLVRAAEATDRDGTLIPHGERRRATETARAKSAEAAAGDAAVDSWIGARAQALLAILDERWRRLPALRRATRVGRGLGPLLIIPFAAGVATNALGPSRQIQVLAVPLLGLILWNVATLGILLVRGWLLSRLLPAVSPAGSWWVGLLENLLCRSVMRAGSSESQTSADGRDDVVRRTLVAYGEDWLPTVQPLALARVRRWLHASALVLVAGAVAGMYFRGLVWEYRVTWESTFLSDGAAEWILTRLLAPAGAVLGMDVPPVPLAEIRGPELSGAAAPWIHLWAVTAGLFVGIPRALLIFVESRRCARLSRRLPVSLPETYLRRLIAAADGSVRRVEVVPYSHRPGTSPFAALKDLMLDLFGARTNVSLQATLDYGAESPEPSDAACVVVLFSLAQTPEIEVHGELLKTLREQLDDGAALLTVVDASVYRQRLGDNNAAGNDADGVGTRLDERRKGWDRVVDDAGLKAVHIDLGLPLADDVMNRSVAAAWPPGILERSA